MNGELVTTLPAVHAKRIEVRWNDQDALGHVNNAVYLNYVEEVRDEWLASTLGPETIGGWLIARIEIDYRSVLSREDVATVARCSLVRIGRTSIRTREVLETESGRLVSESEAVLVACDPATSAPRPLTDEERAALAAELEPAPV
jgi:acyl-CoA thioester hydrolase